MKVRAPNGMSLSEAFVALYEKARVLKAGEDLQSHAVEVPQSPWNAMQVFNAYCSGGQCEYVRGRLVKAHFGDFPLIDVAGYDKQYGRGAAEKAMQFYQRTRNSRTPKEGFDLNSDPCAYFTAFWKDRTPEHQRKDLEEMFNRCTQSREV